MEPLPEDKERLTVSELELDEVSSEPLRHSSSSSSLKESGPEDSLTVLVQGKC